jgi:hypothetical protein
MAVQFPSLIGMPTPQVLAYPPQTVIAEKLEAMTALGVTNGRVKDLYDVWAISLAFDLDGKSVVAAVRETFTRRGTVLKPGRPPMLSATYTGDASRQSLWRAFLSNRAEIVGAPPELPAMAEEAAPFIVPIMDAAAGATRLGRWNAKHRRWSS